MACQAVCQAGNFIFWLLQMTVKAPAHVHFPGCACDRHATNIAMAGLTIFTGLQVYLMTEINKFRLLANASPRNWLAALPVTSHRLDGCVIRRNETVAAHTFFQGRYSGYV